MYELSEDEKKEIYECIRVLDPESYPDNYDPQAGKVYTDPSMTLILTVRSNGMKKTINAEDIAIHYESKNKKGQAFLTTCKEIEKILKETEEWKALPEYEFKYE